MTAAEAIAEDERRHARDRWRADGGSHRRALRTFSTKAERAERRRELKAEREVAKSQVRDDPATYQEWERCLRLNGHLSPNNAAMVAARLGGGVIVGSARWWRSNGASIRKGTEAAIYLTGPPHLRFAPVAHYCASQTTAGAELTDLEEGGPISSSDVDVPW